MCEVTEVPEARRAAYVEDYVAAVRKLQDDVDARKERLEEEAADIAVDLIPGSPEEVSAFVGHLVADAEEVADKVIAHLGKIHHPAMRSVVAAAIRDIVGYGAAELTAAQVRGEDVAGAEKA